MKALFSSFFQNWRAALSATFPKIFNFRKGQSLENQQLERIRYFWGRHARGVSFAVFEHPARLWEVADRFRREQRGLLVLNLSPGENALPPVAQIREALERNPKTKSILIPNLGDCVKSRGADFSQTLNFSREALNALNVPIVFFIENAQFGLFRQHAEDLFSQRGMATVFEENLPEKMAVENSPEEIRELEARRILLENQLRVAESQTGFPEERLLGDIVLPLLRVLVSIGGKPEMFLKLFDKYSLRLSNQEILAIETLGMLLQIIPNNRFDENTEFLRRYAHAYFTMVNSKLKRQTEVPELLLQKGNLPLWYVDIALLIMAILFALFWATCIFPVFPIKIEDKGLSVVLNVGTVITLFAFFLMPYYWYKPFRFKLIVGQLFYGKNAWKFLWK